MLAIIIYLLVSFGLFIFDIGLRQYYGITDVAKPLETFLLILFFIIVIRLSKYIFTKVVASVLLVTSYVLQYGHYAIYKSWLSAIEIYLFFEKFEEVVASSSMLLEQLIIPLVVGVSVFLLVIFLLKVKSIGSEYLPKNKVIDIIFLFFILIPSVKAAFSHNAQDVAPNLRHSAIRANYNTSTYFLAKTLPNQVFGLGQHTKWQRSAPQSVDDFSVSSRTVKNIVLIMGESQNTDNMSVFGYDKQTSPFLSAIKKIALIKETYAAGTFTDVSLPTFFNMIAQPDGSQHIFSWKTNLFRLAKEHGYNTYFYSAQARDTMSLMSLLGQQYITDFKDPVSLGYDVNHSMQDEELLPLLENIDFSKERNFIVLHQIGSHSPYSDRSLSKNKPFGRNTLEDEYNNSVFKTDQLISSVYNKLQQQPEDWLLIYTSDHGQYVKGGAFGHGSLDNQDHYLVPTVIITQHQYTQSVLKDKFVPCQRLFHLQVSSLIVNVMGYAEPIAGCASGVVNGPRLDGSAGFKSINQ